MESSFNATSYLQFIAEELIMNFTSAGQATTPSLVGGAREKATRSKLQTLLPPFVGVGTGCIIDSFGNTSKQIDIVIYEKNICPVFSINDTPETTYFPCEGVIAAGEIKSTLDNAALKDIFAKVNSVKELKRYAVPSKGVLVPGETVSFRHYGNLGSFECTKKEEFDQLKMTDQTFCFAFCGELGVRPTSLLDEFHTLSQTVPSSNWINIISILNHGLMVYLDRNKNAIHYSFGLGANGVYLTGKRSNNFEFLVNRLTEIVQKGRTSETKGFSRYILPSAGDVLLDGTFKDL